MMWDNGSQWSNNFASSDEFLGFGDGQVEIENMKEVGFRRSRRG
jgi:hypothetical protein